MLHILKGFKKRGKFVVIMGADDEFELEEQAAEQAVRYARKRGYPQACDVGEIVTKGQNQLLRREFVFEK